MIRRIFLVLAVALAFGTAALLPTRPAFAQDGGTYVVQPGDNLFRISIRFNTTVAALQQANGIGNANLIYVGQVIRIPTGTGTPVTATPVSPVTATPAPVVTATPPPTTGGTYTVQAGDSLYRIATRFGVTAQAIVAANGIANPNLIYVGQVLRIPGGGTSPVPGVTPIPGQPTPAPISGAFEGGGQVLELNGNTQQVLRSSRLIWAKAQVRSGDTNGVPLVQQFKAAGFKVLISLTGDKNSVLDENFRTTYAQYAASLASAGADAIEVWNEQNLDREWVTGRISGSSYVGLLSRAFNAIKAANANTIVISGAPAPTGAEGAFPGRVVNDDNYYRQMALANAANFADCIGVHYNEGIVPPNVVTGDPRGDNYPTRYLVPQLNRALASFPGKPACFTEIGYLSPEGYGPLPAGFEWARNTTKEQQAQWLGQAFGILRNGGRTRMAIVFNVDFPTYGADPQAGYAIIRPGNVCIACAYLAQALQ